MNSHLQDELAAFAQARLKAGVSPQISNEAPRNGKYLYIDGKRSVDLTRCDYLSLGQNNQAREIMRSSILDFDIACPGSQMILQTGSNIRLEQAISEFHGAEDTVMFMSGFCANDDVIQALSLRMHMPHMGHYVHAAPELQESSAISTEFFVDSETHFSLIRGIKIANLVNRNGGLHRYHTANYEQLIQQLEVSWKKFGDKMVRIIVTDTISSISGRLYDVAALCKIAERFDCMLYLDEAHAIGSVGKEGAGVASMFPEIHKYRERLIIMGAFTKALAQLGGYVAFPSKNLAEFIRCASPHYIFSAPTPPWMAEANVRILELLRGDYGNREREKLQAISAYAREELVTYGFDILGSESHVIPVLVGDEETGIQVRAYLQEHGFTSALFRSPAVPKGKSTIRFTLCSDITVDEIDRLTETIRAARQKFGF